MQQLQQIFFNLDEFPFPVPDIDRPWDDLNDIEEDFKIAR